MYKRGGEEKRKFDAIDAESGNKVTIEWMQPSYYSSGEWPAGASVYKLTYSFEDEDDCGNVRVNIATYTKTAEYASKCYRDE